MMTIPEIRYPVGAGKTYIRFLGRLYEEYFESEPSPDGESVTFRYGWRPVSPATREATASGAVS